MKIHKGVVVDVIKDKDIVIVLTPDADVRKVETDGRTFKIGDEVIFYEIEVKKGIPWSRRVIRYVSVLAAGLLIFFVSPVSNLDGVIGNKNDAYAASVYIESKSNVKVGINKDHEVVSVEPLNDPAKRVLKGMDWNGEEISNFLDDYFAAAKQNGYLGPYDKAVIAVDPANNTETEPTIQTIQKDLQQNSFIKANNIQVFTVAVPDVVVKKAAALGMTPGKLSIYLAATQSGEEMPLDVVKVASVTDLVEAVPVVTKVLPSLSEEKLVQLVQQNASAPKTEVAVTQAGTTTSSNTATTQNTNPSKDAKPSADSSAKSQSAPVSGSAASSTDNAQKQSDNKQPDTSQPQSNNAAGASPSKSDNAQQQNNISSGAGSQQSTQSKAGQDNSSGGSDSTKQPENQPAKQDGQPSSSKQPDQPDSKKQPGSQPQEGQPQNQPQGQPQNSQPLQSNLQNSQPQSNQSQSGSQPQNQPQDQPDQPQNQPQDQPDQPQNQPQGQSTNLDIKVGKLAIAISWYK